MAVLRTFYLCFCPYCPAPTINNTIFTLETVTLLVRFHDVKLSKRTVVYISTTIVASCNHLETCRLITVSSLRQIG